MTALLKKILIINGPNLNLLGHRETSIYGQGTLQDLEQTVKNYFQMHADLTLDFFQSNHEGEILDIIHQSKGYDGIVINAGAFTHTSIALVDALVGINIKFAEVHISNVFSRETFRHHSYLSSAACVVICGAGFKGYIYAVDYLINT